MRGRAAAGARVARWVAAVPVGFEALAAQEVKERFGAAAERSGPGEVRFSVPDPADPPDPHILRCAEAVFVRVVEIPSSMGERAGPRELIPAARRAAADILAAAELARGADLGRARTVRFVTRMEGGYPYPRQHLRDKVERDIAPVLGQRFRQVDRRAGLEIWVTAGRDQLALDVRISSDTLRHRGYKQAHLPGSLRAAAAAACVRYAKPEDGEVFCDPFCGTGTIGIERALCGVRYGALLLGDREPRAIEAATVNFGPRHQPRLLCQWDARSLPLADGTVDVVVTNPPFGGKVPSSNARDLYGATLAEAARVLRPGGRLVMVAADREVVLAEAKREARLGNGGMLRVELQGREASVLRFFRSG